jgi:COMPASS component SPP1
MYCKRLKVICPEHEKERKVNDDEVCGYPLPNPANIMEDSVHELCLAPKRSCTIHLKWEKLRRAQLDHEKLRVWLKLEELYEQKRANETALSQRKSLLSILLNQTILENGGASSGVSAANSDDQISRQSPTTSSDLHATTKQEAGEIIA